MDKETRMKRYEEIGKAKDSALDNDGTTETIWMAIRDIGDMMGLKEKED